METKVNVDQFKAFCRENLPVARALLFARIHAEQTRAHVKSYTRPIFEAYRFEYGALGNHCNLVGLLKDDSEMYLIDDLHGPKAEAYYDALTVAHKAHGYDLAPGFCPALMAEHAVIEAENALVELARPLFGVDVYHLYGKNRQRYLELLIGGCIAAEREVAHA